MDLNLKYCSRNRIIGCTINCSIECDAAYRRLVFNESKNIKRDEKLIITNPICSFQYTYEKLKKRFIIAEKEISKNYSLSYLYFKILKDNNIKFPKNNTIYKKAKIQEIYYIREEILYL